MKNLQKTIQTLQRLNELQGPHLAAWAEMLSPDERQKAIEKTMGDLSSGMQEKHLSFMRRHKRSLVPVRNGICGGCHIQLPKGHNTPSALDQPDVCEHCGVILDWPGEIPEAEAAEPLKKSPSRKSRQAVAGSRVGV